METNPVDRRRLEAGVDTRRDFGDDFRGGRVLQASLNVSKEVQHEFNLQEDFVIFDDVGFPGG